MKNEFDSHPTETCRKAHAFPCIRKSLLPLAESAWVLAASCAAGWIAASIH
ncbi:hypothetical protein [Methylorubrum populi]